MKNEKVFYSYSSLIVASKAAQFFPSGSYEDTSADVPESSSMESITEKPKTEAEKAAEKSVDTLFNNAETCNQKIIFDCDETLTTMHSF